MDNILERCLLAFFDYCDSKKEQVGIGPVLQADRMVRWLEVVSNNKGLACRKIQLTAWINSAGWGG